MQKSSDNINKFRKQQQKLKKMRTFLVLLIVIFIVFMLYLFKDSVFQPLKGIAGKIVNSETGSFPVQLPGSASYGFDSADDVISLLTDTYLYTYSADGAYIESFQHKYSNPKQKTYENRIMLYDKGGKTFSTYSKNKQIYEKTTDENIIFGTIGINNTVAVITSSANYAGILTIFTQDGLSFYTWKSYNSLMAATFNSDASKAFTADITTEAGEFISKINCLSFTNSTGPEWTAEVKGAIPYGLYIIKQGLLAVYDDRAVLLNEMTGEVLGEYDFSQKLANYAIGKDSAVLLFSDTLTNGKNAVLLGGGLNPVAVTVPQNGGEKFIYSGDEILLLSGSSLEVFDENLVSQKLISLNDSFSSLISIDGKIILLGYDCLEKLSSDGNTKTASATDTRG